MGAEEELRALSTRTSQTERKLEIVSVESRGRPNSRNFWVRAETFDAMLSKSS